MEKVAKYNLTKRITALIDTQTECFRIEDSGQAVIIDIDFFDVDEDSGVALAFTSWHEGGDTHPWLEKQFKRFRNKITKKL